MGRKQTLLSVWVLVGAVGFGSHAWSQARPESPGGEGLKSGRQQPAGEVGKEPGAKESRQQPGGEVGKEPSAKQGRGEQAGQEQMALPKEEVKKIQEALKERGFDPGPVDGIMGPNTAKALRDFQTSKGLKASGRIDEQTKKDLGIDEASSSKPEGAIAPQGKQGKQDKAAPKADKSKP